MERDPALWFEKVLILGTVSLQPVMPGGICRFGNSWFDSHV
jgi:hypothetical protein